MPHRLIASNYSFNFEKFGKFLLVNNVIHFAYHAYLKYLMTQQKYQAKTYLVGDFSVCFQLGH